MTMKGPHHVMLIYKCFQVYHVYDMEMIKVWVFFKLCTLFRMASQLAKGLWSTQLPIAKDFWFASTPPRIENPWQAKMLLGGGWGGGGGSVKLDQTFHRSTCIQKKNLLKIYYTTTLKAVLVIIIKIPCGRTASMVTINKMSIVLFKCMQVVQKYISLCCRMLNLCLQDKACNRIRINRNFTTESLSKSRHCVHKSQRC